MASASPDDSRSFQDPAFEAFVDSRDEPSQVRVLVYCHDLFGLGNTTRMLLLCEQIRQSHPDACVLFLSGSPVIQSFRLPEGLDYVKLPCLQRDRQGGVSAKYLKCDTQQLLRLRSEIILAAATSFRPDVVVVDKKPLGAYDELAPTLEWLRASSPHVRCTLVLRDILDAPEATRRVWKEGAYDRQIEAYYDQVLVVGRRDVFDVAQEYQLKDETAAKLRYSGYLKAPPPQRSRSEVRRGLRFRDDRPLVLVTPGGGEDGFEIVKAYLQGLRQGLGGTEVQSFILTGPQMADAQQEEILRLAGDAKQTVVEEFHQDVVSAMNAADVIVSMGGYNSVCKIVGLRRRAVVIPRCEPVQEQLIRVKRLSRLGMIRMLHPSRLTPATLLDQVNQELAGSESPPTDCAAMESLGLESQHIMALAKT